MYEHDGAVDELPVHIWLDVETVGQVRCHCAPSGALTLTVEPPYATVEMQDLGRVVLREAEPVVLMRQVGEAVQQVLLLDQDPPGMTVGFVLVLPSGSVAVANLGDELFVEPWPGRWRDSDVHVNTGH